MSRVLTQSRPWPLKNPLTKHVEEALINDGRHVYIRQFVQEMETSIAATRTKVHLPSCFDVIRWVSKEPQEGNQA